jgi:hypothetical protein
VTLAATQATGVSRISLGIFDLQGDRLTPPMLLEVRCHDFTDAVLADSVDVYLSRSRMEGPPAGTTEGAKCAASWKDAWHGFDCTVSGHGGPMTCPLQGLTRD